MSADPSPAETTPITLADMERSALELLQYLPSESLRRLARHTTRGVIRQKRIEERDDLVRQIGAVYHGDLQSGAAIAGAIHLALSRFAAGADAKWPEPPEDPRRAALHHLLRLCLGKVPEDRTLRKALAGLQS